MERWRSKKVVLFLVLLVVPLYFVACGDSSSRRYYGPVATAELSEESVTTWLEGVQANIPGCFVVEEETPVTPPALASVNVFKALTTVFDDISPIVKAPAADPQVTTSSVLPFSWEFAGECGGMLTLTFISHSGGVTTYKVEAADFCLVLDEEPVTPSALPQAQLSVLEGATVVNGVMDLVVIGTPSDSGPVLSKVNAAILDVVTIDQLDTPEVDLELSGSASYTFGTPGVEPAAPTAAKPDTLYVGQALLGFGEDQIAVRDLTLLAWEAPVDPEVEEIDDTYIDVVGGHYVTSGGRVALLATDPPLRINDDFELVDGALNVTGAAGTSMTISASDTPGVFEFLVNGEPLDKKLDCSAALFFQEEE